jgi:hypothetical protein
MATFFKPNGRLDVNNEATDIADIDMVRLKNLTIDKIGSVATRAGVSVIASVGSSSINHLTVQAGVRFAFAGTNIYQTESSIAGSLTNAQWSSIQYNAYNDTTQQVFCLNGADRKRIESGVVREWGIDAPTTDPTAIYPSNQSGNLSGTYSFVYTLVRKVGTAIVFESNPSDPSDEITVTTGGILGHITIPSTATITHIRVYRTLLSGGSQWYYDKEFAITTQYEYSYTYTFEMLEGYLSGDGSKASTEDTTNLREYLFDWELDFLFAATSDNGGVETNVGSEIWYFSDTPDGSLGDSVETDHDRPPLGTFVLGPNFEGVCFIIKDNNLYYSLAKRPEYWPALNYIEVSTPQDPGKALVFSNGQPYFVTENEIYYIQGTGAGTFQPLAMRARTGTQSPLGVISVDGHGIYHVGRDGLYLFAGGNDKKITQNTLNPIFTGTTVGAMPAASDLSTSWLVVWRNKLYFGYASSGYTYPTNVIVMQLDEPRRVTYYSYPYQIRCVTVDTENDYLLAGCNDGYIRRLETGTDDNGTAISWDIQSKDFELQTRKHFPRWAKYDIDASDATSVSAEFIMDGAVHHTHAITGNRDVKRRLVDIGNGSRISHRVSGSGPVTIYAIESE